MNLMKSAQSSFNLNARTGNINTFGHNLKKLDPVGVIAAYSVATLPIAALKKDLSKETIASTGVMSSLLATFFMIMAAKKVLK